MSVPTHLDHLVYLCPDLEAGMAEIEAKLGTAPIKGGSHPGWGTCNALMSLGERAYLELLAPDPASERPAAIPNLDTLPPEGRLATWVMRSSDIERTALAARDAGAAIGDVFEGQRATPDGTVLKWQLSQPFAFPFGGCAPFLIDWGNSPHPAKTTPSGGSLTGFALEHPQAAELRAVFDAMGEEVEVREGAAPRVCATIVGANGEVTLG